MTTDDPETQAADTALSDPTPETVAVPPSGPTSIPEFAWSSSEDTVPMRSWGNSALRAGLLVGVGFLVAYAVIMTWIAVTGSRPSAPTAQPTKPPVTTPAPVTVTAPPPVTVTQSAAAPAPPPAQAPATPAPPAAAQNVFIVCPDGHEGVVGGHTSCAFAENVQRMFYAAGQPDSVVAYSPVTGERYEMDCESGYVAHFFDGATRTSTRCTGGDNAEVVLW
jgi:hypothetical protein